jgi:4'-phosphopantetheinyl transferase
MSSAVIHLYYATLRDLGSAAESLLVDEDRERLSAIDHPRRRAQSLAGRALLRFALERCTGQPGGAVRLRTSASGKPECVDGPAVSVAHDADLVACAVSSAAPVGVDVQTRAPGRSTHAIARSYFAPAEAEWVAAGGPERFYMLWVLKEAYLKASGQGLAGGLDALQCRIHPPSIEAQTAANGEPPALALFAIGAAYVAVAALGVSGAEIRVERWRPRADAAGSGDALQLIAKSG